MTVYLNLTKPAHGATDWDTPINTNFDLLDTEASISLHTTTSGELEALDEKTTPVDADILVIEDSEDGYSKKKLLISNLPVITTSGTTTSGSTGATIINRILGEAYATNSTALTPIYASPSGLKEGGMARAFIIGSCILGGGGTAELRIGQNIVETLTESVDFDATIEIDMYDDGQDLAYFTYTSLNLMSPSVTYEVVKSLHAGGKIYTDDDALAFIQFTTAHNDNLVYIDAYTEILIP